MFSMSLNKQTWRISFCRVVRETRDLYIGGIQQQCHTGNPEILHHTQEKEIVRKTHILVLMIFNESAALFMANKV
jgi:hypothetical protein